MSPIRKIFALFFLLSLSTSVWALPIETCRKENENYETGLNAQLDEIEKRYLQYRWAEAKIRRMFYDNLWEARTLANDPLSREKRESGQDLEKKYMQVLKLLQAESENAANGFVQQIAKLKQTGRKISSLCERQEVQTCLIQSYDPFYKRMDQGAEIFSRIFERETEYRTAVENSSGGRDGLYAEDALEPQGDHTDFYWRFEQPKNQERFEEDAEMMRLLMAARQFLNLEDTGESCCRQCI